MRVFLCLFIFLAYSCSDNNDSAPEDCVPVSFDSSKFNSSANYGALINDFTIDGNCLSISLGVSGCDDVHPIEMVSDGAIAESFPPQITFDFYDGTPQDCEAIFTLDREFDLSPIRELYDGEIIIRFRNSDKSVTYLP